MKERIIKTASERFFRFGLRKTTMDEISADLGVSKKTLYKYFPGKETLAEEVVRVFQEGILKLIDDIRREVTDPIERLERCVFEISRRRSEMGNLFPYDIKRDLPRLWKKIEDFREKVILSYMDDILQEGIIKGKIRSDINTTIAARVYLGAIQTIMQPDLLNKGTFSTEEAFLNINKIFMEGVRAR